MHELSLHREIVFIGENVINSGRVYGTLNNVALDKCLEMPVCENLIAGVAIGLSLEGYHPICIFQRMDFMLIAADAIINHAALLPRINKRIKLNIIFRTIKATLNDNFWVGYQHSKDLTYIFEPYVLTHRVDKDNDPTDIYPRLWDSGGVNLVVEDYADYEEEIE